MPACIDCAAATLRSQHWERPGVMRGWLRCTTRDDRVGRYLSPFADRTCPNFDPLPADQASDRRAKCP